MHEMTDDEVEQLVTGQLRELLSISGGADMFHLKRWKRAIPQCRLGYEEVTAKCGTFEDANSGLFFCSNFYRGISMSDCVKNAFQTADDVEAYLKSNEQVDPT